MTSETSSAFLGVPMAANNSSKLQRTNVIKRALTRAKSKRNLTDVRSKEAQEVSQRVIVDGDEGDKDYLKTAKLIAEVILSRDRYKEIDKGDEEDAEVDIDPDKTELNLEDGIYTYSGMKTQPVSWKQYVEDVLRVFLTIDSKHSGPVLSVSRSRLTILQEKFDLYSLLNTGIEEKADQWRKGGGVYAQCTKVDTAVRLSTCNTGNQLLKTIVDVATRMPDVECTVKKDTGKRLTVKEMLAQHGIKDAADMTVEGLGLHPPLRKRFHAFDMFNPKLNIGGEATSEILLAFLKHNGPSNGKLYGEVVRPVLAAREKSVDQRVIATEYKIPLFGRCHDELAVLAHWVKGQGLNTYENNMWVLQIPRFVHLRQIYECETQEDQLRFIFYPMFMATLYPDRVEFAEIAELLERVGSINIISDEKFRKQDFHKDGKPPTTFAWLDEVVPDYYFFYYIWANLCTLNSLRKKRGMNVILFRPTCGENTPHFDQLVASYLLADGINQGLRLAHCWQLQYLYMFSRIGIAMSPLSNNSLYVNYFDNPFPIFFKRGLNVSLATDDPLHYHHNADPLIEEYGTAMRMYHLTATDMTEIAYNSVVQSAFPIQKKMEWLGPNYMLGVDGNDITRSNLSDFRLQFRTESLLHEQNVLNQVLTQANTDPTKAPMVIGKIKARRHHVGPDLLLQFRNQRRINYTDRRIAYPRIDIFGGFGKQEAILKRGAEALLRVQKIRERYVSAQVQQQITTSVEDVFDPYAAFDEAVWEFENYYGVFIVFRIGRAPSWPPNIPKVDDYIADVSRIKKEVVGDTDLASVAQHRLELLRHKFLLHQAMNIAREAGKLEEKETNNRDFYTAYKIDTNIVTAAGMNARTLLNFFQDKAIHHSQDVVMEEHTNPVTLRQLLDRFNVNVHRLTADELQYFLSTNHIMNETFLSPFNYMGGRYFAELTKKSLELYKLDAYTFTELRLSLVGAAQKEWHVLSQWFDGYGMVSRQNKWLINIPRGYRKLKQNGKVESFGEFLENIFAPLWEASLHPAENTKLHYFLCHVSGFDSIDDESKVDLPLTSVTPHDWRTDRNPPYGYYLYYLWANIQSLNDFRASRKLNTFTFRPQCGEVGTSADHLISGYMLANSINHGVALRHFPALEYLFYVDQVGISVSCLANTTTSVAYLENPFPSYFYRGLNVTLSTYQPLNTHFTRESLIEEYSIMSKISKLSFNDLSEIARNSVLQSGFSHDFKVNALGQLYKLHSTLGNDVTKSRVSDIRVAYRFEIYHTEANFLDQLLENRMTIRRAMKLLEDEVEEYQNYTGKAVEMTLDDDEDDDDLLEETGEPTAQKDNAVKSSQLIKKEISRLTNDLAKTRLLMEQLQTSNKDMAGNINDLRSRSGDAVRINAALQM